MSSIRRAQSARSSPSVPRTGTALPTSKSVDELQRTLVALFDEFHWPLDLQKLAHTQPHHAIMSRVLLGMFAVKCKVSLHLRDSVVDEVAALLKEHQENNKDRKGTDDTKDTEVTKDAKEKKETASKSPVASSDIRPFLLTSFQQSRNVVTVVDLKEEEAPPTAAAWSESFSEGTSGPVPASEDFMIATHNVSAIAAIPFPNLFLTLYNCIRATNLLVDGVNTNSAEQLEKVVLFLQQEVDQRSTYCTGKIRMKEPHTYTYDSSVGPIQIGVPPETIKTSMRQGEAVPQVFILPPNLFSGEENFGEIEFPIYFNYFIKKAFMNPENRIILVGEEDHLERVRKVFKESFYGPDADQIFTHQEISPSKVATGYTVNLKAEKYSICDKDKDGNVTPMSSFANFQPFDANGTVNLSLKQQSSGKQVTILIRNHHGFLQFLEDGVLCGSVDTNITLHAHECVHFHQPSIPDEEVHASSSFNPPTFGVTFLGTSHGFDIKGNTTGFIIWVNGSGILVDPPPFTTKYLQENGIPASFVRKAILTHCHSDHDSGLIRQIIAGERIELLTTSTVNESYKRKMNAITGLNIGDFYDFVPVPIGQTIRILGASFEFDYSFHTIPTVRFKAQFGSKIISYSADTCYNPRLYSTLREKGVITPERENSLNMFLFDADLIIHECGIPPIHTPISILNDLPTTIKKKMAIVHCQGIPATVEKELADGTKVTVPVKDLAIPKCGLANTIRLDVGAFMEGVSNASMRMKMLSDIFLFRNLSPSSVHEIYAQCEEEEVQEGEVLIGSGEHSDLFYIIYRGRVTVYHGKDQLKEQIAAKLHSGDVFGENALRRARFIPRSATVVASTNCILLKISATAFRSILDKDQNSKTSIDYDLSRMTRMRPFVKEVLSKTYLFQNLTSDQINFIAATLEQEAHFKKDDYIIHEGDTERSLFIVKVGSIRLERLDVEGVPKELMRLGVGELFGELSLITGLPRTCSVIANEDTILLELKQDAYDKLVNHHQNLRYKLALLVEQRLKESQKVQDELRKSNSTSLPPHLQM